MVNEKKTYALVNKNTGKVVKYLGKLQYFRLKQRARIEKEKIETDTKQKIDIIGIKQFKSGPLTNKEAKK